METLTRKESFDTEGKGGGEQAGTRENSWEGMLVSDRRMGGVYFFFLGIYREKEAT